MHAYIPDAALSFSDFPRVLNDGLEMGQLVTTLRQ